LVVGLVMPRPGDRRRRVADELRRRWRWRRGDAVEQEEREDSAREAREEEQKRNEEAQKAREEAAEERREAYKEAREDAER
jgi:hypothetical protein